MPVRVVRVPPRESMEPSKGSYLAQLPSFGKLTCSAFLCDEGRLGLSSRFRVYLDPQKYVE